MIGGWARRRAVMVVTAVVGAAGAWLLLGPSAATAWTELGAVTDFTSGWPVIAVPNSQTALEADTGAPVAEGAQLAAAAGWSQVRASAGPAGPAWAGFPVLAGHRSCAVISGVASVGQLGAYARAITAPLVLVSAQTTQAGTVTTVLCTVSAHTVAP